MEASIESILELLGYLGIFLLMTANGAVSFPSSQVLYIISGYFIFTGALSLPLVVISGTLGNTVGCIILYELARARGMHYITKFPMFPMYIIRRVQYAFEKRGRWFVFIGKLIPALKVAVPIPAGIAHMHRGWYTLMIALSSFIWTLPFIAVGYLFGKSTEVFQNYVIILGIIGVVIMIAFYRYIHTDPYILQREHADGHGEDAEHIKEPSETQERT